MSAAFVVCYRCSQDTGPADNVTVEDRLRQLETHWKLSPDCENYNFGFRLEGQPASASTHASCREREKRLAEYAIHKFPCIGERCAFGPMKLRAVCLQPKDGCHPGHEFTAGCICGLTEILRTIAGWDDLADALRAAG